MSNSTTATATTPATLVARLAGGLRTPDTAPDPLPTGAIAADTQHALMAAARVAPSADNGQIWRFVTVRKAETRQALAKAVPDALATAVSQAPLCIVACGIKWLFKGVRREQPFAIIDVPIALTHVLLTAQELGLETAWTLQADEAAVQELLGIPTSARVIAVLALGEGA